MSAEPTPALPKPRRSVPVRLFNAAGRLLRRCGWRRPLSSDRILARACRHTGLRDFGELDVREPLGRLVEALEQHNRLTPLGRLLIEKVLVRLAQARLGVQNALTRYPEILQERVSRPLFVLGLPRTGTTLLQRLLAQDPSARALFLWEVNHPAPGPLVDRERQIRRTRWDLSFFLRHLAPSMQAMHPMAVDEPEECRRLLMNTFRTAAFRWYGHIPSYVNWLDSLGPGHTRRVYQEYRKQLQLLQWLAPPRRWILKCPMHASALDTLLEVFPDACIVQTHRALTEVVPSAVSLRAAHLPIYAEEVDLRRVAAEVIESVTSRNLRPAMRARAAHPGRIFDVQYSCLVADPVGIVRGIYDRFGLPLSGAAVDNMRRWLACNPQGKHGRHRYSLEQFGLDRATVEGLFPGYPECLAQPAEPCHS